MIPSPFFLKPQNGKGQRDHHLSSLFLFFFFQVKLQVPIFCDSVDLRAGRSEDKKISPKWELNTTPSGPQVTELTTTLSRYLSFS